MKKYTLTIIFCLIFSGFVLSQIQLGQGINSWFNKSPEYHNMSFVSLTSVPTISFISGSRLDGFKNNPRYNTLLASGFIMDELGLGLKLKSESAGLSSNIDAQIALIYRVFINKEMGDKLSFSLGGHFMQDRFRFDNAVVINTDDPALNGLSEYQPNGNASVGIAVLREDKYHVGISAYNLIENSNSFLNPSLTNSRQRTMYLIGSYTIQANENFSVDINMAGLMANMNTAQIEAGADIKYNKSFWFGTGYNSSGGIKFNVGLTAQSWSFGYMCLYGAWVDATNYSYKAINNSIFITKVFNEGRPNK